MLRNKTTLFVLALALAGCAGASPEDVQMSMSLSEQGKSLLVSGKYDQARDIYQSAVARDDKNARAWNGLGVAQDMLGKKDLALDAYQSAYDLKPDDAGITNNLAHAYLGMGDAEKAAELLHPFLQSATAPAVLKKNYEAAMKIVNSDKSLGKDIYADLGSFPTPGMAEGRSQQARALLGSSAEQLTFTTVTEVKVGGGTPVFTVKVTGGKPQDICDDLRDEAIPCIPYGVKP